MLRSPALPFLTTTSGLSFALGEQVWFLKRVWVPDETNIEASHCRIPHGTLLTTDFVLSGRWLSGMGAAPSRARQHIPTLGGTGARLVYNYRVPSCGDQHSSLPSTVDLQLTPRRQRHLQVNAAACTHPARWANAGGGKASVLVQVRLEYPASGCLCAEGLNLPIYPYAGKENLPKSLKCPALWRQRTTWPGHVSPVKPLSKRRPRRQGCDGGAGV